MPSETYPCKSYTMDWSRCPTDLKGEIKRGVSRPVESTRLAWHSDRLVEGVCNRLRLCAAWNERESRGLEVPFPPVEERFERLEETLQIARQMWSANNGHYNGKYFQLAETLRHKLDTLKAQCDPLGREYAAMEKTSLAMVHIAPGQKTVKDGIDQCGTLAALGIQHAIFNMPNVHEIKPLETFGKEIIPAAQDFQWDGAFSAPKCRVFSPAVILENSASVLGGSWREVRAHPVSHRASRSLYGGVTGS